MRNHYWTCGKFADWLRGTPSPGALTSSDWKKWHKQAQAAHPVRYWLADDGLDYLQKFVFYIPDKLYDIKYYINNRWVSRCHQLTAHPKDIKPGQWTDVGNRFLPCLFNELVDFVEVELAWWHIAWSDKDLKKIYHAPFWATGWFRWRSWRNVQAGLDNLEWQRNLRWKEHEVSNPSSIGELTPQAINAQEMLDLYRWWTQERPQRVEPMEASGWSAYCESKRKAGGSVLDILDDDDGNPIDTTPMHDKIRELEDKYDKEDEDMMIRLIKIRSALWT
jgi:hypothetical protein